MSYLCRNGVQFAVSCYNFLKIACRCIVPIPVPVLVSMHPRVFDQIGLPSSYRTNHKNTPRGGIGLSKAKKRFSTRWEMKTISLT